jgi:hypothetical protein
VASIPLGAELRLDGDPDSAEIAIDGASVGRGHWSGRLPRGRHHVHANEPGYHSYSSEVLVEEHGSPALEIKLRVDPTHPRWPRPLAGQPFVHAVVGYAFGPTLNASAEHNCARECSKGFVHGLVAGGRGGYRFPFGLSLELAAGYLRLELAASRTLAAQAAPPFGDLEYRLDDRLLTHGPFGGFGLGYRRWLTKRIAVSTRAMFLAGASLASDDIAARAATLGQEATLVVRDADPVSRSAMLLLHADAGIVARFTNVELGLSVAMLGSFVRGPVLDGRSLALPAHECSASGGIGCIESGVPLDRITGPEHAHGALFLVSPQLHAGYAF